MVEVSIGGAVAILTDASAVRLPDGKLIIGGKQTPQIGMEEPAAV